MSNFIRFAKRFFGKRRAATPRRVAKERLEQTLVQDRLDAQYLESIKGELLATLSKYFELDNSCADVSLLTDGKLTSFTVSVPVRKIKRCAVNTEESCYDMVKGDV